MGFLLDRTALTAAAHPGILGVAARGETPRPDGASEEGGWDSNNADVVELEVEFLMVAFSAAVNTTPEERLRQVCAKTRCGCCGFCAHEDRDVHRSQARLFRSASFSAAEAFR